MNTLKSTKPQIIAAFFGMALLLSVPTQLSAQHSVARQWNEALLEGIRNDFARPTVHARNLFHSSALMYSAWAAYDTVSTPYMLGEAIGGFACPFDSVPTPVDAEAAREEAISYAMYRLLKHRFSGSPGSTYVMDLIDSLMFDLGYDTTITTTNYTIGPPAALGNYLAQCMINFGFQDGANEQNDYVNTRYTPLNPPLAVELPGNPDIIDPNHWQPLTLDVYIDQSGNVIPLNTPPFLSPEWGDVVPFSMSDWTRNQYNRDGDNYWVYHDPGMPPQLDDGDGGYLSDEYKWTHTLVAVWSSHLDPSDSVMWDVSPASIGNIQDYPRTFEEHRDFYDLYGGGDPSQGYSVNPATGQPYAPQVVPRGDYARILAEFWADGPDSETPPGHWFTIINYVNDHPMLEKRWRGQGPIMDDLEWDVKSYFALAGAMHDVAVSSWGIKGWYDYLRPISAIRYMADQGQCTDTTLLNYSPKGIPLHPGYVEVVEAGDPLAGSSNQHVGKIKLFAWRGPDYINNPATDDAGVGWILAENWWPYQRPSFVTPPFAGYVSGHSTYSRAAAELLTLLTGDEYFPGGMGEFPAPKNQFLVFEEGPSVDVTLQWAKYRDASDQCSLSRIWGGIHPPADDIPGRLIGEIIGVDAFNYAETYFGYPDLRQPRVISITPSVATITDQDTGTATFSLTILFDEDMDTSLAPVVTFPNEDPTAKTLTANSGNSNWQDFATYVVKYDVADSSETMERIDVIVAGLTGQDGNAMFEYEAVDNFNIDTKNPNVANITASESIITDANVGPGAFTIEVTFTEAMDTSASVGLTFPAEDPSFRTLVRDPLASSWTDDLHFMAMYDVRDSSETLTNIDVSIGVCHDREGNALETIDVQDVFQVDTENPIATNVSASTGVINDSNTGQAGFSLTVMFSEDMDTTLKPAVAPLQALAPAAYVLTDNSSSSWVSLNKYVAVFDVTDSAETITSVDVLVITGADLNGNAMEQFYGSNLFAVDTKNPAPDQLVVSHNLITDVQQGTATFTISIVFDEDMDTTFVPTVTFPAEDPSSTLSLNGIGSKWMGTDTYNAVFDVTDIGEVLSDIDVGVNGGKDMNGNNVNVVFAQMDLFSIDMSNPYIQSLTASDDVIAEADSGAGMFSLTVAFNEDMNMGATPVISFPIEDPSSTLSFNSGLSGWRSASTFEALYDVANASETLSDIDVEVIGTANLVGNENEPFSARNLFDIDTRNPEVSFLVASDDPVSIMDTGAAKFTLSLVFDEYMDTAIAPVISFPTENPTINTLTFNATNSSWGSQVAYDARYDITPSFEVLRDIDVEVDGAFDIAGNQVTDYDAVDYFSLNLADTNATGIGLVKNDVNLIKVYPNPISFGENLIVELAPISSDVAIKLFSIEGMIISEMIVKKRETHQQLLLNTERLSSGVYVLRLTGESVNSSVRMNVID